MPKGELTTSSIKIDRLRNKILEGDIKIPPFQRRFVWKQDQIIELLDSIINDYPIGSILLWETNDDLPAKRNIGGYVLPQSKPDYPITYVLDGQQRITSIFGVFCNELQFEESEENTDQELFDIEYDIIGEKFISKKDSFNTLKTLPLKLLFDNFTFNNFLQEKKYNLEETNSAVALQSIFQNYELPLVSIKKRTKSEVGIIFERINNTGTPLSTFDLMIAWTWMEDFHLKEKFEEIYDSLEQKNFGNTKNKVLLQSLSAIIKKTTKTAEIITLDPESVRSSMETLKDSLEKTIDFISTQFNAKSEDFLPKSHQLVPLTYLFSQTNQLSTDQSNIIQNWFWRTSFSDRYTAGTDAKMDEDIDFFDKVLNNDFSNLNRYTIQVNEAILIKQSFSKSSPFTRATLLLLSKLNPLDITTGDIIDTGYALSSYNRKEYHHIFPKNYLKTHQTKNSEINSICNFCFLTASSNKRISNRAPSDYFFNLIPKEKFDKIIETNLLPKETRCYSENLYDDFLKSRAKMIFANIKRLSDL
jgi:hypothetical protein